MNRLSAPISEIFLSLQGEGIYAGVVQIFVRFAGCNLSCGYCDTPQKQKGKDYTLDDILKNISKLNKGRIKASVVSLTGGEPLLHSEMIKVLSMALQSQEYKVLLETNGTLPENLKYVIRDIDVISMDIKMPSSCAHELWRKHKQFLEIARNKNVYVKIVVEPHTREDEFLRAVNIIKKVRADIPLIIQPVTCKNKISQAAVKKSFYFEELARRHLADVRIIPQMHVMIGVK